MSDELMTSVLQSMKGATLREISFGAAAIVLECSKTNSEGWTERFRIKTACFVYFSENYFNDYESNLVNDFAVMYRCIEKGISDVYVSSEEAIISFDDSVKCRIRDVEQLWDNLFSVQVITSQGASEFLFGGK